MTKLENGGDGLEPGPVISKPMRTTCVQSVGHLAAETELGSGDVHVITHRSAGHVCQQVRAIRLLFFLPREWHHGL